MPFVGQQKRSCHETCKTFILLVIKTQTNDIQSAPRLDPGPFEHLAETSKWIPLRALVSRGYLESVSATIGAGTSEIQRNIIAQKGLGLSRG